MIHLHLKMKMRSLMWGVNTCPRLNKRRTLSIKEVSNTKSLEENLSNLNHVKNLKSRDNLVVPPKRKLDLSNYQEWKQLKV